MKRVKELIFRYLSKNEYFVIYKPAGTERSGGGQKYIDFGISAVGVNVWKSFFSNVDGIKITNAARGPRWEVPIYSPGHGTPQSPPVAVYQRRKTSFCVGSQNIYSSKSRRIIAWHPDNGFPKPKDNTKKDQLPKGLAVYLLKTYDNEIWAGWFINGSKIPTQNRGAKELLAEMLTPERDAEDAGYMNFEGAYLYFDSFDLDKPFIASSNQTSENVTISIDQKKKVEIQKKKDKKTRQNIIRKSRDEDEIISALFYEDEDYEKDRISVLEKSVEIRRRNEKAVKNLKKLYKGYCQISGKDFVFKKKDGNNYVEAHHLLPLGEGGADNAHNIIIVNALIHRMLHYADVSGIDLSKLKKSKDGSAELKFKINGEPYTIKWHPKHAEIVLKK